MGIYKYSLVQGQHPRSYAQKYATNIASAAGDLEGIFCIKTICLLMIYACVVGGGEDLELNTVLSNKQVLTILICLFNREIH